MILSRNRIKEEKTVQYHMRQAFFHQVDPELEVFLHVGNYNLLEILRSLKTL